MLAVIAAACSLMVAAVTTVNLATQVFGLLPVANGGTGVSTATANTLFAGPGSGSAAAPSFRAQVAADAPVITSTVGQDGIYNNGTSLFTGSTWTTGTPVNSTMYVMQLNLPRSEVIGHATVDVTTGGASEIFYACLYNPAGTTLLWSASGAVNSIAVDSFSATQYTALPGSYLLGWEQTGTTAAVFEAFNSLSPAQAAVTNKNGTRWATAANGVSGSACPTQLGTLTAITTALTPPIIALEP